MELVGGGKGKRVKGKGELTDRKGEREWGMGGVLGS